VTDLPGYLKRPPKHDHDWARPTTWLLGSQVASRLKQLLLSQIHRGFDIRDWMSAPPPNPPSTRDEADAPPRPEPGDDPGPRWIDYVSDTGDAPRLVYQLAYLLQQDTLPIEPRGDGPEPRPFWRWPRRAQGTTRAPGNAGAGSPAAVHALPRGAVLVIGGDTAYPVADEPSLNERVRAPFLWARERLVREKKLTETPARVRLYGLPANHDYYDMLNGFARQFREPCTGEDGVAAKGERAPLLQLPGYVRKQQASYFALRLAFDWQLWGIDAEYEIDTRQVEYFRSIQPQPRKLIVAASQPVIVHRAPIDERHRIDMAYKELRLARVYRSHPGHAGHVAGNGGAAESQEPQAPREPQLGDDQARLDLSGDIHVYERYYGATCNEAKPSGCEPEGESRSNYAAVVSGLGGVFHHAGQVRLGNVAAQSAWPLPGQSARDIGWMLMRPRMVWQAGSAGLVGAAFALLLCLLATEVDPARSVLHLPWRIAGGDPVWPAVGALGRTFLYLVCVGVWCGLVAGARWWRGQVHESMEAAPQDWPRASRWLFQIIDGWPLHRVLEFFGANSRSAHAFVLTAIPRFAVVAGLAGLIALATVDWFAFEGAHTAANVVVLLFLSMTVGLGWMGGAGLGARRILVLVFALVHGVLQIVTPLLWTPFLIERPEYVVGVLAGCYLLPRLSWCLLGTGEKTRRIVFLVLWLALAAVFVALPFLLASDARPVPVPVLEFAWPHALVAAVTGALFTCLWLGWYLLVSVQWNAHGNEAASVARVARYAAFLRIELTADGAEVWAIQAHEDESQQPDERGERKIVARVIDHFRVGVAETPQASTIHARPE
jgi:hypothetical protein